MTRINRLPPSMLGALLGLLAALVVLYPQLAVILLLIFTGYLVGKVWEQQNGA